MIFGFGKGGDDAEEFEEDIELVIFQGALNGKEANLKANARLVEAGLGPAKELITDGMLRRAETIRIEPKGERAAVTMIIDGVAYPGARLSRQQAVAVTQTMKLLAGLDVKQRRKAQAGGIKAELEEKAYELQVDSAPVAGGSERLIVRVNDLSLNLNSPEELGISPDLKAKIREATGKKRGILLACGPPRSGVTTAAFGLLRCVDAYLYAIFTIRDPGRRPVTNVTTFEANEGDDLTETLRRCIRVEADVIFLDPIVDAEIAKVVFDHRDKVTLISEFAAKDAATGIAQLCKWVGDPKIVADGLEGILNQKLLRKLCEDCKEGYRPNPKLLAKVGLPKETEVLYRQYRPPEGDGRRPAPVDACETCGGIGYFGRAAMFEYIEMTDDMRKAVASGASPANIKAQARSEGMLTLQKDGLRLVANGATSLEELQRAFKA